MGTPATVLEARGVKKSDKGMASQSMVTLFSAFFVACVVGVTFAYPSNIQEILGHENAENTARIEKVLSHFSPEEPQQYDKDIEKRNSKSFSAWGGKRGGQGSQFSAWGGKRSDWVDLVRTQLAEEALREMAQRRPNRVVRAGRASFSAWGGRK